MTKEIQQELSKMVGQVSFPQAVRLSLNHLKTLYSNEPIEKLYAKMSFRGNTSLAFQKSEIADAKIVQFEYGYGIELTVNFLAVFGSASPLPSHYSEMVLQDVDKEGVLRDYLDLFNHNLEKFIYPIWEKNRYYIRYQDDLEDGFSKYILSLIGLYDFKKQAYKTLKIEKLLPFLGLLMLKNKSTSTLIPIIKHYCDHQNIEIIECVERDVKIPMWQYSKLGEKNCNLGQSCLCGESMRSKNTMFRIFFRDVVWDDLMQYSPTGEKMAALSDLMDFLLNEPLIYDVSLEVQTANLSSMSLGDIKTSFLGVNTIIGTPTQSLKVNFINEGPK